ncbi:MAG: hypothetical protein DBY36_00655 [Clostridiales bacterium]|nr:MAG: hypothetical protein DBY36_00655 [Clostridiales bacterium]
MTLKEKAAILDQRMRRDHLIDGGLVGSSVNCDQQGNLVDPDDKVFAHAVTWTGIYLSGLGFKYAATHDEAVRKDADEVLRCMTNCIHLSGTPGVLCRGYLLMHGLTEEERGDGLSDKIVMQGKGKFAGMRYITSPSHHNHDHYIRGLTTYYILAADDKQKEQIRENLQILGERVYIKDKMNSLLPDGDPSTAILFEPNDVPGDTLLMAMAGAKMLFHVTGDQRFGDLYEHLCSRLGVEKYQTPEAIAANGQLRRDHDDAEHTFADLFVLDRIEEDPVKRGFYRAYLEQLWNIFKDDLMTPFNFFKGAILGGDYDRAGAIDSLEGYDIEGWFEPKLNTVQKRPNLTLTDKGKTAIRMKDRPIDNEFEWKGSPCRMDGWLARTVTRFISNAEDDTIMTFLTEHGELIRGYNNERFEMLPVPAGAVDIIYSRQTLRVMLAATNDGVYISRSGGFQWKKVNIPCSKASRVYEDLYHDNVFYAVTDCGIFKSVDFNATMNSIGTIWKVAEAEIPCRDDELARNGLENTYINFFDGAAHFVRSSDGRIYQKAEGESDWQQTKTYFAAFWHSSAVKPSVVPGGTVYGLSGCAGHKTVFKRSPEDGYIVSLGVEGYAPDGWAKGHGLEGLHVIDYAFAGDVLYVSTNRGLYKSENKFDFERVDKGMEIDFISNFAVFPDLGLIYMSTPGGIYVQDMNSGENKRILCLNGSGLKRRKRAPADFLYAYWMGRCFGFIGENE